MRYTLTKTFRFEASHQLIGHDGKCARLHGHSWLLEVTISGDRLITEGPKAGMLIDYDVIKAYVSPMVERYLDHWHLNESLQTPRPTSEFVAGWAYQYLRRCFDESLALSVTVHETCTASCQVTQ